MIWSTLKNKRTQMNILKFNQLCPLKSLTTKSLLQKVSELIQFLIGFVPFKFTLTKFLFITTLGGVNEKSPKAGYCPHCAKVHNIFFYITQNHFKL